MSRPSSRKGKKEKKKTPKQQIADLTAENAELTTTLETLRADHDQMTIKVLALTKKILEGVNKRDFGIQDSTQLLTINPDSLMNMVGHLIVQKKIYDMSVEARVEELELRVTQMSGQLAKMMKKTMAYEQGLSDVAASRDLDEVRDKIYNLQLIAGEEFHHFESHEALHEKKSPVILGEIERPSSATRKTLENAVKLNLVPPLRKLPGETHIRNMNRDLRLYVMKGLSMQKPSGSDWRMFGERCGIAAEMLAHWQSLNLDCPMGRVLSQWGESPTATVRQMHRHLMSPRMRCTILGKMVSDFYDVD